MTSLILATSTRILTPVIVMVSVYLLIRGHDAPGGGFIGALVAGAAVVLNYLSHGIAGVSRLLPVTAGTLLGVGLLLATSVGLAGLAVGGEFLEGAIWKWHSPLGEVKITASLFFDIGVFFIVVGVIVAIMRYLGEEHEAAP